MRRLRVVGREMFGEFEPGGDSALVELRDELPDRDHRLRRSACARWSSREMSRSAATWTAASWCSPRLSWNALSRRTKALRGASCSKPAKHSSRYRSFFASLRRSWICSGGESGRIKRPRLIKLACARAMRLVTIFPSGLLPVDARAVVGCGLSPPRRRGRPSARWPRPTASARVSVSCADSLRRSSSACTGSSAATTSPVSELVSAVQLMRWTSRSRAGPVTAPSQPKLFLGPLDDRRRKHLLALGEHGARASDRHAQVVEELGIESFDGALPVRGDGLAQVGEHGAEADDRGHRRDRGGRPSIRTAPARLTPVAAAATVSVSPSSRDSPIWASASRALVACLAYPASSSTSIVHRATSSPSLRTCSKIVTVATTLPARLCRRPAERFAVTRRIGRSARTSTTAARRERNGPGGRSVGETRNRRDDEPGAGGPLARQQELSGRRTRAARVEDLRRAGARSNVSSNDRVTVRDGPNSKPIPASSATTVAGLWSSPAKVATSMSITGLTLPVPGEQQPMRSTPSRASTARATPNTVIQPGATDEWSGIRSTRRALPVIAIYIVTKNMTVEQHTKGRDRLREAGAPESAMKLHSCFGEDGALQVFDVWESQEAFDEFLTYLGPVMQELGIELAQPPVIMPIVDLVQQ